MEISFYFEKDIFEIATLFQNTVRFVNSKDYDPQQIEAWAGKLPDLTAWNESFLKNHTFTAKENGIVKGFGDIDKKGYLNRLYVHHLYQNKGIASALCNRLENAAPFETITVHASLTAKKFFLDRGYRVIKNNFVLRNGVRIPNFYMEKPMR